MAYVALATALLGTTLLAGRLPAGGWSWDLLDGLGLAFAHADHQTVNCVGCHHEFVDATPRGPCLDCHETDRTVAAHRTALARALSRLPRGA